MAKSRLVGGALSRLAWLVALLVLSYFTFTTSHVAADSFEFSPYSSFFAAGVVAVAVGQLIALYAINDEKLADQHFRDCSLAWLYMFIFAPILSVNLLPDLPINPATFAEIGITVDKGMVTNQQLGKIHMSLWNESGRNDWLPEAIPRLTNFAPVMRFKVPRSELEHSTRQIARTSRGERRVDYDLLIAKFLLPEITPSALELEDEDEDEATGTDATADGATPADGAAPADGADATNGDAATPKDSDAPADGNADAKPAEGAEGATGAEGGAAADDADTAAAPKPDAGDDGLEDVAAKSYVQMVIRASPKLEMWPHPKRKSKKAMKRIMAEEITICGKFFNGIPRGEAMDEAATKLDRDLPKEAESLAFSFRAEGCSWEPFLFGHFGVGIYCLYIPLYIVARIFIGFFSRSVMNGQSSDNIMDEFYSIIDFVSKTYRSVVAQGGIQGVIKNMSAKKE